MNMKNPFLKTKSPLVPVLVTPGVPGKTPDNSALALLKPAVKPRFAEKKVSELRVSLVRVALVIWALMPLASMAAPFTAGNLTVIQTSSSANNTTGSILELNTTTVGQSAVQTIAIDGATEPNQLRFSGSASSTCYLTRSADGTLLVFMGANNTNTTANVNTLNPRGVGTLNPFGTFGLKTTYTGTSGQQTRSATSLDNNNWFIADQLGLYSNNGSAPTTTVNIRGIKPFGGAVYVLSTTTGTNVISSVSSPTATTVTGLPGLAADSAATDFYMISSGSNGSAYDVLYVLAGSTIKKYSLVTGSWTANSTYTTNTMFSLAAVKSGSGAVLYLTTGSGANAANSVMKVTDTAGYNANISITTANNVILYTAPAGNTVKGIDFAPNGIVTSGTLSAVSTTYGTASSAASFTASGAGLTADLVVTAPSGFEVSTTVGSGYGASVALTPTSGTVSATTIYLRLAATATVGSYSGNVVCTSTGVTTQNVAMPSSTVSAKALTITGLSGVPRNYDGTTAATLSGTAALSGVLAGDVSNVTLGGSPTATFSTAGAGTGKAITVTGYSISGSAAANYSLTQPSGLTADINQAPLTVTANNVSKALGATLTSGSGSTAFSSSGLVNSETIGTVTITYGSGAAAGDPVGTYTGSVVPSAPTGGTFTAANYAITYTAGDINVSASPAINVSGALSAVNATYSSASPTPTSFTASGGNLTGNLTVTAPANFEVSVTLGSGYGSSLILTAAGGMVANTTIYVRLAAGPLVGSYSGNVSVSGGGAGTQTVAIPSSTVSARGLTITGLSGVNKVYDRNNTATLTGTAALSGVVSGDESNVTLAGTPSATFGTVTVGATKAITVTGYSLTGSAAAQYSLAQPASLTADITAKALTISSAAVTTKTYDGNANATITGTLTGVIAPDVVTFTGTGTFASAGPGVGLAVTSTSTLGGADAGNYSLTQPTGLTGTISGSANADLSALTVNGGQLWLSPTFASGTTNYTTYPDHDTNSITITPTVAEASATIKVNGTTVASGVASGAISLNDGTNIITVVVTAQDTVTSKTNTIYAIRSAASLPTGTIAFVGFNADGNDDVAFVALTNIPINTVIHFTDRNWNGSAIGAGGAFTNSESEWVWIAPAGGLAAGTVVTFTNVGSGTITPSSGTAEFVDTANRGLSTTAETMYAFQGPTRVPTVFLAGITTDSGAPFLNTGLSSGAAVTLSSSSDGARYKGTRTGQTTFAAYLALIADVATNWDDIGNGDGTTYLPFSTTAFTATAFDANVSINDVSITEGDASTKTLTVTVTRTSSAGAFTIDYATADGSGGNAATTANSDYVATTGTLTFPAGGALTMSVNITINGDTTAESDETFFVNLSNVINSLGAATVTKAQGVGTILNDDPVAPSISTQPASQSIATGNSATMTVVATGTPAPTYQWYSGASGNTASPISGATSASYTTPALLASASYWVRVSNASGTADSTTATITVTYATPYSSAGLDVLTPNTAAWNPAGVTVNGTTFINLGLQGMGRVPASAIDSATGESLGSISDMQISGWKKNANGSYTGTLNTLPDRGYNNGATFSNYRARINNFDFTFTPYTSGSPTTAQNQIALTFTGSTAFTYNNGSGQKYTTGLPADGTASLFGTTVPVAAGNTTQSDGTVANRLTLDSEGLILDQRPGKIGAGWIGDEYGASIYHFNAAKQIDGQLILPAALIPHNPVGTVNFNGTPVNGRRDNQGMEGIAQSPDGTRLFALMQSATVQDTGTGNQGRLNTRLLVYDISSTDTPTDPIAQYVIQLPRIDSTGSTSNGATVDRTGAQSAIVALNAQQILILARDGNGRGASGAPVFKSILLADLAAASNIDGTYDAEGNQVSPSGTLLGTITPVAWTEALNMVGKLGSTAAEVAKFGLNLNTAPGDTNTICEKWEALSLVSANDPANPNDYFLFVGNDNDFVTGTGKYLDASGTVQSYNAGLENDTLVLVWRVRMTGSFNQAPFAANAIADQAAFATVPFSLTFAANTFADPESQTLTYTATKADGSALPAWLSFTPGTRTFSGTPSAGDAGTLVVKVTATDNGTPNLSGSTTFTITTVLAPVILTQPAVSTTVNAGGTTTLMASVNGATSYQWYQDGLALAGATNATLTVNNAQGAIGTNYTGPSTAVTPVLDSLVSGYAFQALFSAGETVNYKADGVTPYRMVGIPDGLGAFDNGNGTFTLLMNHELGNTAGTNRTHGGKGAFVSRWIINKADLSVVNISDLITNVFLWDTVGSSYTNSTTTAFNRFCAADLPVVSAFYNAGTGLGTQNRIFMNGEESGKEGRAFAHLVTGADAGKTYELPYLGKIAWENAVASPFAQNKTIVGCQDDSTTANSRVNFYIGTKASTGLDIAKAGLTGGTLYGVKLSGFTNETDVAVPANGTTFSLFSYGNASAMTGAQLEAQAVANGVASFQRAEDGAWDPNNPRDYYFVSTATFTGKSRLWRLRFSDITNPENGGTIDLLMNGTEGQKMFDNIGFDADGNLVLQEDPGNQSYLARMWKYVPATGAAFPIATFRTNLFTSGQSGFLTQDEESSGVVDVTSILGYKAMLLVGQIHTAAGIPAGASATEIIENGQLLLLRAVDSGSYSLVAANTSGSVTSTVATVTVTDTTAPTVALSAPSANITAGGPVTYTVTYTDGNLGAIALTTGNITLNKTGTADGSVAVSGTGFNIRTVTISSITGNGTLGISLAAATASDVAGNSAPAAGPSTTFTVDNTAPTVAISAPSVSSTANGPVIYTVTYADANFSASTLGIGGVTFNQTGAANGSLAVTGSGTTRTVTISSISGTGTLGISLVAGTAGDAAGNLAPAAGPSATFSVAPATPINIYITGSTAFRGAAYDSILALYDVGVNVNAGGLNGSSQLVTVGNPQAPLAPSSASLFNEQNYMTFGGTMSAQFGGAVVTIYCNWSGSVEGIRDVTQGNTLPFLSTAVSLTTAFTNTPTSAVADFTFSDVFQATTPYRSPTLQNTNVGVIPFALVKNQGAPANLNNLAHQQARTLFASGALPLSYLTGDLSNGGDTNRVACLIGRNDGSGTRYVVFADTGYGALKSSVNYKYGATANAGSPAFTQVTPDPNIGHSSGSSVATDLSQNISSALGLDGISYVTGYAIGYLGIKDAFSVTGNSGGALNLAYNGVPYSAAAVRNGQYTLWGYQHLYNKSGLSASLTTFKSSLAATIPNNLGTGTSASGLAISTMTVQRSVDGGPIGTLY